MTIYIGSDHAGYDLKAILMDRFPTHEFVDLGPSSCDSVDYPDYGHKVAENVLKDDQSLGIVICGSGNGIAMTANKHAGIRAALAWNPEIASLGRSHNNANVLSLPARYVTPDEAIAIVEAFLAAEFEGGRHARRVGKINVTGAC